MMGTTKTEFKWFTIPQYRREEEYLSTMHGKGWKLTRVSFPGFYHFEKCEPEQMSYRLDYNQEGIAHKADYVQMFADCGWEYLFDFVGYSYFRKASDQAEMNEEIFCDEESRLDMMKRVMKGRVVPLIIIFFCVILPQYVLHSIGYGSRGIVQDSLSVCFLVLGLIYLLIFGSFSVQFYRYEKSIYPEKSIKGKYIGIFAGLAICAALMGYIAFDFFSSDYKLEDRANGFTIEAESLNKSIVKEFDLKKGDIVWVYHQGNGGRLYISIGKENEEPVFYGNTQTSFGDFSVEIQEDGLYTIECSGKRARGMVEFVIE